MPRLFWKLFMSAQRRKNIEKLLSDNAKDYEALQTRIDDDERNERAEIMRQFVQDMLDAGADISSEESDQLTEEAERKCNEIGDKAQAQREEARQAFERRNKQIISLG